MAVRALHFLATSAVIAEARSGTELSTMQPSAVIAHPNFSLPNMNIPSLGGHNAVVDAMFPCVVTPVIITRRPIFWYWRRPYTGLAEVLIWTMRTACESNEFGRFYTERSRSAGAGFQRSPVRFVIARVVDTVHSSPEHMRQAVYDLARYKLREQFNRSEKIRRTQQALEDGAVAELRNGRRNRGADLVLSRDLLNATNGSHGLRRSRGRGNRI